MSFLDGIAKTAEVFFGLCVNEKMKLDAADYPKSVTCRS